MAVCFFSLMCVAVHSGHTSLYYVNSVEGKRSGTARQDGLRITERGVPTAVTGVDSVRASGMANMVNPFSERRLSTCSLQVFQCDCVGLWAYCSVSLQCIGHSFRQWFEVS